MSDAKYQPRLKQLYKDQVRASLLEQFGYSNEMEVPVSTRS